jgi:tetratricopeptide (TPR) repeat protein
LEQAHFFLGRCQYAYGDTDSAIASFSRTLPSDDTLLASAAHLWRGRARAVLGEYEGAIVDFSASSLVDAAFDLSLAYARLGRRAEAERVLRWRVDGEYREGLWLATLDSIGEHLPELSATIAELLLELPDLGKTERGNLLLQDGDRWSEQGENVRAISRFQQVVAVASGEPAGFTARFRLIVADLRSTADLSRLPAWSDSLAGVADLFGAIQPAIPEIASAVEMAAVSLQNRAEGDGAADDWRLQNPDLEMFLAAEALRDRVNATTLAAALFQEIVNRFPRSPLAPKALLAAAALDPDAADSLMATVRRLYPWSPYTMVLRGAALDAYAAIEDSLRTLILARRGAI